SHRWPPVGNIRKATGFPDNRTAGRDRFLRIACTPAPLRLRDQCLGAIYHQEKGCCDMTQGISKGSRCSTKERRQGRHIDENVCQTLPLRPAEAASASSDS